MCRCPDAGKATMGTITKAQAEEVGVHTTRHCSSRPEQAKRPEPTHVMLQDTASGRTIRTRRHLVGERPTTKHRSDFWVCFREYKYWED